MGSQFNGGDEESLVEPLNYSSSQQLSRLTNTTSQLALVGVNVCPIESLDYEYVVQLTFLVTLVDFIHLGV